MPADPIYLDHNATTPVLPAVVDAMLPYLREHFGNPSSGHVYGQRARAAVDAARDRVASLVLVACHSGSTVVGGGHERGLRPGTENVAYIVGLGHACAVAEQDLGAEADRQRALRDRLHAALADVIPGLRLHGPMSDRLPNTLNLGVPGVSGRAMLAACPDLAASNGSACHEGHETPSAGLLAMGLTTDQALGAVRLSLGRGTDASDVDRAAAALIRAWRTLSAGNPSVSS